MIRTSRSATIRVESASGVHYPTIERLTRERRPCLFVRWVATVGLTIAGLSILAIIF